MKSKLSNTGEILRALHNESGITQSEVAGKLGITHQAYSGYMDREVGLDTFMAIVDALGYHIEIRPGRTGCVEIKREYDKVVDLNEDIRREEVDFYGDEN